MDTTSSARQQTETRLEMMDHLLSPFHQQTGPLVDLHRRMMSRDPAFYGRMAVWNQAHGPARRESFVATLLTSPSTEHREAGFALLQGLSPVQVAHVVKILRRHLGKTPRSARAAVVAYLRSLEALPSVLDQAVAESRRSLKFLYAALHIRPSERADRLLFKGEPVSIGEPAPADPAEPVPSQAVSTEAPSTTASQIRRPTALLIDKSADMDQALETGKRLAVELQNRSNADLHVYAFDLVPYAVKPRDASPEAWNEAFRHLQAAGAMSVGGALEAMRHKRQKVEQAVIVTGKDEHRPRFVEAYGEYSEHLRVRPQVFVFPVGAGVEPFVGRLQQEGLPVEVLDGHPEQNLARLAQPSRADLLAEILAVPLPSRRQAA